MNELIDITAAPLKDLLPTLLLDKTLSDKKTSRNLIWATNAYADHGLGFADTDEMTPEKLTLTPGFTLRPRTAKTAGEDVVRKVETDKREKQKNTIEDDIRDRLRGFARTIPSFLMAYGTDHEITLKTFDQIIPDAVFLEVTSITLDQFRFLRDGGSYTDPETGAEKEFGGHLFDEIVFNDSVKEFLALKQRLANYFDEANTEDIFDYIPPQKTDQIFTPKWVVKDMVDRLEKENPGCFDDPEKTFADLYMKSGMYIAEIVKRLYQSEKIKALYPDDRARLQHIFAEQVYGLAPTEIIYRITLAYILGFIDEIRIEHHHIQCCDTLLYAKAGTLENKLAELFPELVK